MNTVAIGKSAKKEEGKMERSGGEEMQMQIQIQMQMWMLDSHDAGWR